MKKDFDVDGAVQDQVAQLIAKMRARRLSSELPLEQKLNDEKEEPGDDGEQDALEAMLEDTEE